MKHVVLMVFLVLYALQSEGAQIQLAQSSTRPNIDGTISGFEWKDAVKIDTLYQTSPGNNAQPSEKTDVYFLYDEENIYIAAYCYMQDIAHFRAFHSNRDNIDESDRISFILDTFNTKKSAYYFSVNPFGEQADGMFNGAIIDYSVDITFVSKATITDNGYSIEIQIPLESIKYKNGEHVRWRGYFLRYIPGKSEEISLFPIDRNVSGFFENTFEIDFDHMSSGSNLKIIPAVIARQTQTTTLENVKDNIETEKDAEINVLYEPNSNLTMGLTVNPDFSIIEADAMNITINDRYDIFYEEKRPFFIEQTNTYEVPVQIYYSRQIINPSIGAKISGAHGNMSYFTIYAYDRGFENGDNETQYSFSSLNGQYFNKKLRARAALAYTQHESNNNAVVSFDYDWHPSSQVIVSSQIAGASTDTENTIQGTAYSLFSSYDDAIWHFDIGTTAVSPDFQADLGFIPENNYAVYSNTNRWSYRPQDDTQTISSVDIDLCHSVKYDYQHVTLSEWDISQSFRARFAGNFRIVLYHGNQRIVYLDKENNVEEYSLHVVSNTLNWLSLSGGADFGSNISYVIRQPFVKPYTRLVGRMTLRPDKNINVQIIAQRQELDEIYEANTYEIRAKLQFHKNFWIRSILQYSNYEILPGGLKRSVFNVYPLFVYNPSANISLYAGMTSLDNTTDQYSLKLIDTNETNYFFKINYAIRAF